MSNNITYYHLLAGDAFIPSAPLKFTTEKNMYNKMEKDTLKRNLHIFFKNPVRNSELCMLPPLTVSQVPFLGDASKNRHQQTIGLTMFYLFIYLS